MIPARPKVDGILETAIYVEDLERAVRFYQDLFGFETLLSEERMCALSVGGRSVLLLFKIGGTTSPVSAPGGIIPPHDARGRIHFALAIPADSLEAWQQALEAHGVSIESVVHPPLGGTSLYFRDPDGHLVELATPGIWPIY